MTFGQAPKSRGNPPWLPARLLLCEIRIVQRQFQTKRSNGEMNPVPLLPCRKSMRISDFDYSHPGGYFVTIVTQGRKALFGQVVDDEMVLNEKGLMVKEVIDQIPEYYVGVNPGIFVVMPNHIHLLLHMTDVVAGPRACQPESSKNNQPKGVDPTRNPLPLPEVVHRIKYYILANPLN